MLIVEMLKEELRRSPIATICAPLGILVGAGGIGVGYLQLKIASAQGSAAGVTRIAPAVLPGAPNGSIALVVIGVFLALTPSFASITRIFYKFNRFAAVPCSIVIAALSIFLNRLNALVLGYGTAAKPNPSALDNLLFYGTVTIFVAVAGRAPLIDLARPPANATKGESTSSEDAIGALFFIIVAVLIWGSLVGWSQRQMISAFLP